MLQAFEFLFMSTILESASEDESRFYWLLRLEQVSWLSRKK
jgi:hypothetical protein